MHKQRSVLFMDADSNTRKKGMEGAGPNITISSMPTAEMPSTTTGNLCYPQLPTMTERM